MTTYLATGRVRRSKEYVAIAFCSPECRHSEMTVFGGRPYTRIRYRDDDNYEFCEWCAGCRAFIPDAPTHVEFFDECDHEAHGEFCLASEPIEPKETETVGVAFRWSSCACEKGME